MQNYQNFKVDLSNCDKEPIHIIGRIQPHGLLFILNRDTLAVEQVSENIGGFLEVEADKLAGNTLAVLTTPEEYAVLVEVLRKDVQQEVQLLQLQGKQFFGFIHESEGSLVVECEPFERIVSDRSVLQMTGFYSSFQAALDEAETIEEQAVLVVNFVQQLLDYDRVMLYRFDESWNGEVIAEKVKPGVHSYLHHHFPATDIPAQARALLLQKHVRQIADVTAEAVNIIPYINPTTGVPSNIIQSELRNPSEIHLEYLCNMDVLATLSVSIIVKGQLWGIIACQNQKPVFINYWLRQMGLNVARAYANNLLAGQEKRDQNQLEIGHKMEEVLLHQVKACNSIAQGLFGQQHTLLELCEAAGAAMLLNKKLYTVGITPTDEQIQELVNWLSESGATKVYTTRYLSSEFPAAKAYTSEASGLLALEISGTAKEYILYFKPEIQETRIWAGNPEKPVNTDNKRIHPRKSFKKWSEIVKGRSLPWALHELEVTQILLKDIVTYIVSEQTVALKKLNKELKKTSKALRIKNKRLEDFAHIISHNLRSPLSNMLGLYNLYIAEPTHETSQDVMHMMRQMIGNMAETIDDLNLILKREAEQELERQQVSLAEVVEKQLQSLQAVILQTSAIIYSDLQADLVYVPKVYLESILHNLLSNALKYRSSERTPEVTIRSWVEGKQFYLTVSDNGLGMDMNKIRNRLFSIYATFHKNKDAKGLGLYLTKMQVEALGGSITVESEPGAGTTFIVNLPAKL